MPAKRTIEEVDGAVAGDATILSPEQAAHLKPGSKQYKYHQNAVRFQNKKIKITGEYGYNAPLPKTVLTDAEKRCGRPPPLRLSDLVLHRILGKGSYGAVGVVRTQPRDPKHKFDMSQSQLAIKMFDKKEIRRSLPDTHLDDMTETEDWVNLERRNLTRLAWHPFIAGLYNCLQDSKQLYMVMELAHCGSLGKRMKDHGPFPTELCRFYFGNLVAAVEYIHGLGLIHSDLKPDNILIGADGYLMLGDFGCALWDGESRNPHWVGTTSYLAPECHKGQMITNAAKSVDWWALACILFEMASGRRTFPMLRGKADAGETEDEERSAELIARIMEARYYWPDNVKVDVILRDLVDKMLHPKFDQRLGNIVFWSPYTKRLQNDEIREHGFMRDFCWKAMFEKTMLAPGVPTHIPILAEEWHVRPLVKQADVPGLRRERPEPDNQWDNRFISKKEQMRMDRKHEARRERKEVRLSRVGDWRKDTGNYNANANGEASIPSDALAKAKDIIDEINAQMASKLGATASATEGSPSTAPTSPPEIASVDKPEETVGKKPEREPGRMRAFPNIFSLPSKAVDGPSETEEKERSPARQANNVPLPLIFRPVLSRPANPSPQRQPLVKSASKFNLAKRTPPPAGPIFKKPTLPVKVFDNFFGQDFPSLAVSPRKGEAPNEETEWDESA